MSGFASRWSESSGSRRLASETEGVEESRGKRSERLLWRTSLPHCPG